MSSHQPLAILESAHTLATQLCLPWYTTIELGLQCNLACTHCYNFDRSKPIPEHLKEVLSAERILELIDELKQEGALMISFTGGEALLHPRLFDFIKRARENNLLVKVKSNGTLITDELAKKMKEAEVYTVDISLYGSNALEHDWLTTKPGSFDKTIEGIRNLLKYQIPTEINFMLHQKNYQSMKQMIALGESLSGKIFFASEMTKRYDHTSAQTETGITPDQYEYLLNSEHRSYFYARNEEEKLQCSCARTVCAINSKGEVYPCIGAPVVSGNILEKSFGEIWNHSKVFENIRNLKRADFSKCNECELISFCTRSSGNALVNTGDYTGANPPNCMEATLRKKHSGLNNSTRPN